MRSVRLAPAVTLLALAACAARTTTPDELAAESSEGEAALTSPLPRPSPEELRERLEEWRRRLRARPAWQKDCDDEGIYFPRRYWVTVNASRLDDRDPCADLVADRGTWEGVPASNGKKGVCSFTWTGAAGPEGISDLLPLAQVWKSVDHIVAKCEEVNRLEPRHVATIALERASELVLDRIEIADRDGGIVVPGVGCPKTKPQCEEEKTFGVFIPPGLRNARLCLAFRTGTRVTGKCLAIEPRGKQFVRLSFASAKAKAAFGASYDWEDAEPILRVER